MGEGGGSKCMCSDGGRTETMFVRVASISWSVHIGPFSLELARWFETNSANKVF